MVKPGIDFPGNDIAVYNSVDNADDCHAVSICIPKWFIVMPAVLPVNS